MGWTALTRRQNVHEGVRYASDLADAEGALLAPSIPPPKQTGLPRTTCLRDVHDAILYVAPTSCEGRFALN